MKFEYYIFIAFHMIGCGSFEKQEKNLITYDTVANNVSDSDTLSKNLLELDTSSSNTSLYGKTKDEVVEKWADLKKIESKDLVDVYIQNINRQSNLIGITRALDGLDTVDIYHILDLTYNTYNKPGYIELTQRYFGKTVKDIEEIVVPGDAMIYLLSKYQLGDTSSIKRLFSSGITLNSLGVIDFIKTECYFGLANNSFNDKGEGEISYSGGGWGDRYAWKKNGKDIKLMFVSGYSH